MEEARHAIEEIVNRETRAWDTKDADLLLSIFHPDMVWPWPPTNKSHDPIEWVMPQGKFEHHRWKNIYTKLFASHNLVHNRREIQRIEISREQDAAFAVVDVDTLWQTTTGDQSHWKGRSCKIYAKVGDEWKMIMQTGLLEY